MIPVTSRGVCGVAVPMPISPTVGAVALWNTLDPATVVVELNSEREFNAPVPESDPGVPWIP